MSKKMNTLINLALVVSIILSVILVYAIINERNKIVQAQEEEEIARVEAINEEKKQVHEKKVIENQLNNIEYEIRAEVIPETVQLVKGYLPLTSDAFVEIMDIRFRALEGEEINDVNLVFHDIEEEFPELKEDLEYRDSLERFNKLNLEKETLIEELKRKNL